jgi:toxin ParE1/3/4
MTRFVISPLARADIDEIWETSAARWGIDQADSYVSGMRALIHRIADSPEHGRRSDELRPDYRRIGIGSHIIFYRVIDGSVDIVRVLHGKMDHGKHL